MFDAALEGMCRAYKAVVADISNDLEGERQCGSIDIEERNLMARSTTAAADVVIAVGAPGPRGVHRLVRVIAALVDHGVVGGTILPVVNREPGNPRAGRRSLPGARVRPTQSFTPAAPLPSPVFVGERRRLHEVLHWGGRLPDPVVGPVCAGVRMMLERSPQRDASAESEPPLVAVAPGTLGSWYDEQ